MSGPLRVAVSGPDRRGLVAAVTGVLFDLGGNLGDTSFAVLGEGAELAAVCEFATPVSAGEVAEALRALPELAGADIRVSAFERAPSHGPDARATHRIRVRGRDHPGLLARLSETLIEYTGNIVRLNAERLPSAGADFYAIEMDVWLPAERAEACLAAVANTASNLQMSCETAPLGAEAVPGET